MNGTEIGNRIPILPENRLIPVLHLLRCTFPESHDQVLLRRNVQAMHHIACPCNNDRRFPAARHGKKQRHPIDRLNGLFLLEAERFSFVPGIVSGKKAFQIRTDGRI